MMALRAFSLAFLAWHGARLFPGLADPWFLTAAAVLGLFGGAAVRSWRGGLALPAGVGAFVVVDLLFGLPSWWPGSTPSLLDTLPLWADRQLVFSVIPFALGWLEGWLFTGRPNRRGAERLVNAVAAVAVFWSQGPYHVTLYPHPLALALAYGLFLASELVLLAGRPPKALPRVAALLVVVLGVGLLWSLLGRYEDQSTASGGGLMKPDLFQFDFAPLVRLEDEITLGDNLVLLYREEGTPRTRYLRRMVLDDYEPTRGFSVSGGKPPAVGRKSQNFPAEASEERTLVRQEYYLVNLDPSSFLGLNAPVSLTPYAQWNRSSFVNAYRVESLVASDQFWLYNEVTSDGLPTDVRSRNLAGGDDPEIRALAKEWTKGAQTPYEKATAILVQLKEHYYYSLKPGPAGARGALKHFLFEGKKGYCSYFAFSMALLLRSLDIPARIAVGFATNPDDAVLGFTPVRAFQAHAWVEVPFGPYGWLDFDPTSETPAPGEPFQFPKGADPQAISKLIAEILEAQPQPLTDVPAVAAPASTSWDDLWASILATAPWVLLGLVVAVNEAWRWRWWAVRLLADDRRRALLRWHEFVALAHRARRGPRPGETPEAWAEREGQGRELAALVSRVRYAPVAPPEADEQLRGLSHALLRTFEQQRRWYHRAASILFPWWPR